MAPELERDKALFELAVEASPNGMIMVDGNGRILLVNSQTEQIFGYTRDEIIGRNMELLVPPRLRDVHTRHRAGFFAHPSTRAMGAGRDLFGLRKDGTEVPVEIGLNPIKTPEGFFVLASIVDITERRALEKKLAHTEVLAALGQMVAVVAHEIRNPLGSLVIAAKALSRGGLSAADHDEVIAVLTKESQRLNQTLSEFLQFARPRDPKLEMNDLNAVAEEVVGAAKADASIVGNAVVQAAFDRNLPRFRFDSDQIRQVLWNVVRNGFQALNGKGRLEVSTESRPKEAVIHVSDTGPGIPADRLDKIFQPFFTTKTQGTGLGLSTSRNIVLTHGGEILVHSAPGKGSRFSIVLPLKK